MSVGDGPAARDGCRRAAAIDRSTPVRFTFDGRQLYQGFARRHAGLRAAGERRRHRGARASTTTGRAASWRRAGGARRAGRRCDGRARPEPMLRATAVELVDGLVARGLPGTGRWSPAPTGPVRPARTGTARRSSSAAGPAGRGGAGSGARRPAPREQDTLGARSWTSGRSSRTPATAGRGRPRELDRTRCARATVPGVYDHGSAIIAQRSSDRAVGGAPLARAAAADRARDGRHRAAHRVRATTTGRASCSRARHARTCDRYGVRPGTRAAIFTTNDRRDERRDLAAAGIEIARVVDARHRRRA